MTDKAKPPQPMEFKNLAELKRYIKLGTEFKATRHKYHPDIVGLTRVVTNAATIRRIVIGRSPTTSCITTSARRSPTPTKTADCSKKNYGREKKSTN